MKFSCPLTLACLATGVCAGPNLMERNFVTIFGVLSKVQSEINNLDSSVKRFGDNFQVVISTADGLVATIDSATTAVQGSSDLDLNEALQLLPAVDGMRDSGSTLSRDFVARRSAIKAIGQCDQTRAKIDKIIAISKKLIAALVSKVPVAVQDIAKTKASEITKVLDEVKDNFVRGKC